MKKSKMLMALLPFLMACESLTTNSPSVTDAPKMMRKFGDNGFRGFKPLHNDKKVKHNKKHISARIRNKHKRNR